MWGNKNKKDPITNNSVVVAPNFINDELENLNQQEDEVNQKIKQIEQQQQQFSNRNQYPQGSYDPSWQNYPQFMQPQQMPPQMQQQMPQQMQQFQSRNGEIIGMEITEGGYLYRIFCESQLRVGGCFIENR